MNRRDFARASAWLLGGVACPYSGATRAQQSMDPVIGFLGSASSHGYADLVAGFQNGLRETGYVDGQNVKIHYRWAEGQYDRLPQLAADLIRNRPALIVAAGGSVSAQAAKAATSDVPILFVNGADPVETGLVPSLSRPGGNITGISLINVELQPKRLELIREAVTGLSDIGVLINPKSVTAEGSRREVEDTAQAIGLRPHFVTASNEREFEKVFSGLQQMNVGAVLLISDPFFNSQSRLLGALATRYRLPAIYAIRDFVAGGGLMSFGPDQVESYREAGVYAGRILKGEKPSDLPVQQSTKFELIINLKTASALGLTIPPTLLARADEVIE